MRVAPKITLTDENRQTLERWARGRRTPARQVLRARIVLAAEEGKENRRIAEELGTDRLLVGKWRKRFADKGLAGIEKDAPRGGRKPTVRDAMATLIVEWTTQKKPAHATHWSTRTLAAELGTSHAMVNRVWERLRYSHVFCLTNSRIRKGVGSWRDFCGGCGCGRPVSGHGVSRRAFGAQHGR